MEGGVRQGFGRHDKSEFEADRLVPASARNGDCASRNGANSAHCSVRLITLPSLAPRSAVFGDDDRVASRALGGVQRLVRPAQEEIG